MKPGTPAWVQLDRAVNAYFPASTSSLSFLIRSLTHGIADVAHSVGGLLAAVGVGDIAMGRILPDGTGRARNRSEFAAGDDPARLARGEIGRCALRRSQRRQRRCQSKED